MSEVARITLFIHDRRGRLETIPDQDLLAALLRETPLITQHDDGSRTFVFDLLDPDGERPGGEPRRADTSLETLRTCGARLGQVARHLGLPLTAALAESAELVAEGELRSMQVPKGRQC
ncbi:hypothetical protein ACLF3G_09015 [Falsiroseomonas sp. HC035]|uniref:hypothetical protein n=1 Tax=Falsiroseomonas sp. HC035 TaxID=3390999 RepID=UPI003D3245D9